MVDQGVARDQDQQRQADADEASRQADDKGLGVEYLGNISQVFNAETFIIGLTAGLIGIGLTLLILIPGNALIHHLAGSQDINAYLPVGGAVILIALSVLLTLLGGLIPSRKAAKSDPVTALRTE